MTKENFKGAWNEFVTRKKRINKFVNDCKKLEKSQRFKQIYPGGRIDPNKKVGVTPDVLKLYWGKTDSFMLQGEILNYGEFSRLSKVSRAAYMALKFENTVEEISKLSADQSKELQKKVDDIGKLFQQLSPKTRESLAQPVSKFFASTTNTALFAAFCGGSTAAIAGLTITSIVKPFVDAGWTNWYATMDGIQFGPSNLALLAGGAATGYVGITIAAIAALAMAIKHILDKVQDYADYQRDRKTLLEISSLLSEVKKSIQKIDATFDKYGAKTGKLEDFLEDQNELWVRYLHTTKRIRNEKKGKQMDIIKSEIARGITNLVLKDADAFASQVQKDTESKMDNVAKANVSKLSGGMSGHQPDKSQNNKSKDPSAILQDTKAENDHIST